MRNKKHIKIEMKEKNEGEQQKAIVIVCPRCKIAKKIKIPVKSINLSKQLTTISIPSGLNCEHGFQAFVDKNFKVRGYQTIDLELIEEKIQEDNNTTLSEEKRSENLALTEGNAIVLHKRTKELNVRSILLVRISEIDSEGKVDIILEKGMTLPLIAHTIELYKNEFISKRQGSSIIPLDEFTLIIHYFENRGDIFLIIYIDEKETITSYSQLYLFTRKIRNKIRLNSSLAVVKSIITHSVEVLKE